jgi:hypothetical protein
MNAESRRILRDASRPVLFLVWIGTWVGVPWFVLEVLRAGAAGFLYSGIAMMVGPPVLWLALRGGGEPEKSRPYRSPAPFVVLSLLFGVGAAVVASSGALTWIILAVPTLFFAAMVEATRRANRSS